MNPIKSEVEAIFDGANIEHHVISYLNQYPGQACESAFYILFESVMMDSGASDQLKKMACLLDQELEGMA